MQGIADEVLTCALLSGHEGMHRSPGGASWNALAEDPISPLVAGAASMHEIFLAYIAAGFTRDEALRIVIAFLTK